MPPKKEINMQIGERIKEARLSAGATQERLAEKINVSVQYVSDLERGKVGTSIPTLIKICRALHTSSDFLLFGKKDESEELQAAESLLCSLNEEQLKIVEQAIQITRKALEYESDE